MNFQQTLSGFKLAIDKELEHYFDIAIADAQRESELIANALEQTKKIALAGGKRIRGALLQCAYSGAGGKEKKRILKIAVAVEFLHLFFLVHDDIIDCGNLRHGQETVHKFFAKKTVKKNDELRSVSFGNSVALIVGDMLFAKANELILQAGFGQRETLEALTYLQGVVKTTIVGQAQDIAIEIGKQANEKEILAMYENKTARYTFQGPLQLGAIFAGTADKKMLKIFSQYASAIGKAYQLQDDILGIFGKKEKIGKSVTSDIEEGKLSIMIVYARENADARDLKSLNETLGKKNLSQKEVQSFKAILIKTGAKKYAQDLAGKYLERGKKEIEKAPLLSSSRNFLIGMVEYLEKRDI